MDEIEHYQRLSELVPSHPWDATVPILIQRGTQLAPHGTGTLFAVGTDCFLITAAHVLRSAKDTETSVYAATPENDFVQLSGNWIVSNDEESNGVLDVAGLILGDELKQRFESARLLRLSDVSFDFNVQYGVFCVYGYPAIWMHKNDENPSTLDSKAIQYATYTYEGSTSSLKDFDSRYHLALNASLDEARDENAEAVDFSYRGGVPARFPGDLGGISGCSVWHVGDRRHTLEKWPTVEPRIVGIETCVYPTKAVMRATRWNAVATMLHNCFPQTRSVFDLHGIS